MALESHWRSALDYSYSFHQPNISSLRGIGTESVSWSFYCSHNLSTGRLIKFALTVTALGSLFSVSVQAVSLCHLHTKKWFGCMKYIHTYNAHSYRVREILISLFSFWAYPCISDDVLLFIVN